MKSVFLLSVILLASSAALADCPQLSGNYDFGAGQEAIAQDQCKSVTFSSEGYSIVAVVDGTPQSTGDGGFESYSWTSTSLIDTPVNADGTTVPGLITVYTLTTSGDLSIQTTVEGKASTTTVLKRISK